MTIDDFNKQCWIRYAYWDGLPYTHGILKNIERTMALLTLSEMDIDRR